MFVQEGYYLKLLDAIMTMEGRHYSLKVQFISKLDKFHQEVVANQASCSQGVMTKLNKRPYQFKKKGNKAQSLFNKLIDEQIDR